jgi:hypothetical protein
MLHVPKNEHGLQRVTAWVKIILDVRDLTSCHTPLSKQRANDIGILTVYGLQGVTGSHKSIGLVSVFVGLSHDS